MQKTIGYVLLEHVGTKIWPATRVPKDRHMGALNLCSCGQNYRLYNTVVRIVKVFETYISNKWCDCLIKNVHILLGHSDLNLSRLCAEVANKGCDQDLQPLLLKGSFRG